MCPVPPKKLTRSKRQCRRGLNPMSIFWLFLPSPFHNFSAHSTPTCCQSQWSRSWSTWLIWKTPQATRLEVTLSHCPSLPQCWQPSTSELLKCEPIFQGLNDLLPGGQMLLKACKYTTESCVAVRRMLSASLEQSGGLWRGSCPQKPESLQQQPLYRYYQVNRDQSCLLSSFAPDQYLAEQYSLLIQQLSHILPTGFTCKDL